jgi:hypothetical protein
MFWILKLELSGFIDKDDLNLEFNLWCKKVQLMVCRIQLMVELTVGLIVKDEFKSVLGDYSIFNLTEKGEIFIKKWISAESIE